MAYAWFDIGDGRSVYRKVRDEPDNRSHLPCPHFVSDTMDAVQSAADGKFYTSKSAMRAGYLPSGNREGARFEEIGNDPARFAPRKTVQPDRKAIRASLEKAAARAAS